MLVMEQIWREGKEAKFIAVRFQREMSKERQRITKLKDTSSLTRLFPCWQLRIEVAGDAFSIASNYSYNSSNNNNRLLLCLLASSVIFSTKLQPKTG